MKKMILICIVSLFGFAVSLKAAEITIPDDSRPIINKAKVDMVLILMNTKTAKVEMKHGHLVGGNFVGLGKKRVFIFRDVEDDLTTPDVDETSTDFTDFMATISIDRPALRTLIQSKY